MKFFIDTANIGEIKEAVSLGMVDGVTTNPSLVAKEDKPFEDILLEICDLVEGPVSAEVVSLEADGMMAEAESLVKIHKNIVIKLPMTGEGLKAAAECSRKGIKTNVTLVFSPSQALLAARGEPLHDHRREVGARAVDGRGQAGGTGAHDGHRLRRDAGP